MKTELYNYGKTHLSIRSSRKMEWKNQLRNNIATALHFFMSTIGYVATLTDHRHNIIIITML